MKQLEQLRDKIRVMLPDIIRNSDYEDGVKDTLMCVIDEINLMLLEETQSPESSKNE
jgi:hypothetical protein